MSMSLFSAPSSEFSRIKETLTRHHSTYTDRTHYRYGPLPVSWGLLPGLRLTCLRVGASLLFRASAVNAVATKEDKADKDGQGNKAAAVNTAGRNIRSVCAI